MTAPVVGGRIWAVKIREELEALGESADDVAEFLLSRGAKGTHHPNGCPIAVYLHGLGHSPVSVLRSRVIEERDGGDGKPGIHFLKDHPPVQAFLDKFDNFVSERYRHYLNLSIVNPTQYRSGATVL